MYSFSFKGLNLELFGFSIWYQELIFNKLFLMKNTFCPKRTVLSVYSKCSVHLHQPLKKYFWKHFYIFAQNIVVQPFVKQIFLQRRSFNQMSKVQECLLYFFRGLWVLLAPPKSSWRAKKLRICCIYPASSTQIVRVHHNLVNSDKFVWKF